MASYYNQVQEAIKNNEKELQHLQNELRGLRSVEKDTPRESFQRQHAQILYHIDQEQRRLEENRTLLRNFEEAKNAISELREARDNDGLDELRAMLATERDPAIRREILEELEGKERAHAERIEALETKVQTSMSGLTDELQEEVRQSFLVTEEDKKAVTPGKEESKKEEGKAAEEDTTIEVEIEIPEARDERRLQLLADRDRAEDELAEAQEALRVSAERMMGIFAEERRIQEEEGPFTTEEELDNFRSDYMRRKIEENERLEAAKARIAKAERQIARVDARLEEHARLQEEARSYDIDAETLERIKKAVSKKEVLSAVYAQKGLGEVSRDTKEGRELADRVTAEIVENIVAQLREAGITSDVAQQGNVTQNGNGNINQNGININIIDQVNIVYGTDIPVHAGPARTTTATQEEIDTIERTQKARIKVKVIKHNGNEQEGKTPVKGPEDVPVVGATEETKEEEHVAEGPVKVKSLGQIKGAMEIMSKTLAKRGEALEVAQSALEAAKAHGATAEEIARLERDVEKAQSAYDTQLDA